MLNSLTHREHEVATHLKRGRTPKQIARALQISVRMTEHHIANIRHKLEIPSKAHLIEWLTSL